MPYRVPDPFRPSDTSLHVRRARRGDRDSLEWVVERLSPLLLTQARYRLGTRLRRYCDPRDMVQEVWTVALPRLGDLQPRDGRETPVLLRFLATTLVNLVNNLARRHVRRAALMRENDGGDDGPRLDSAVNVGEAGVVTLVARSEAYEQVLAAIDELEPGQREVVVLRAVEQHDNATAARILGETPNAVSLRYNRAIARLRATLGASVFDELV